VAFLFIFVAKEFFIFLKKYEQQKIRSGPSIFLVNRQLKKRQSNLILRSLEIDNSKK
jgi:hypothetical protein